VITSRRARIRSARLARRARGFTLIEVLVAITILVILGALVAPRFGTVRRGEGMLAGDQVEGLVRMWAYRSAMSTQQVGIWRNGETGFISLRVRDINLDNPDEGSLWREDRLSLPVRLPETVEIVDVTSNGEQLDPNDWFVQTNPDRSRPRLSITLRDYAQAETTISIEPYSIETIRNDPGQQVVGRRPVDLDREGQERSRW